MSISCNSYDLYVILYKGVWGYKIRGYILGGYLAGHCDNILSVMLVDNTNIYNNCSIRVAAKFAPDSTVVDASVFDDFEILDVKPIQKSAVFRGDRYYNDGWPYLGVIIKW